MNPPSVPARARFSASGAGRRLCLAAGGFGMGHLLLWSWPELELQLFARVSAWIVGAFSGAPLLAATDGWLLPLAGRSVMVTTACSATDYFGLVSALFAWQLARRGRSAAMVLGVALLCALPLTLLINAVRILTVAEAHRWFIPLLPEAYGAFAHLLTGAAVFLPSLIALNFLLEKYERSRCCPAA